ncbi:MAG TPA: tetratricopeptide repeat protein, partial [Nannocystaceae bacterium]|nr:tetratricopeptide repeat protein [Nannocystaceae bacterium]
SYARFVEEFSSDLEGLWNMAKLQQEIGDHEAALATLQRRLELARELETQTATLEHMADIAEKNLGEPARALELLRRALAVDHFNAAITARIGKLAEQHRLWRELLLVYDERFGYLGHEGQVQRQIELCLEACDVAERRFGDPALAFDWARRGYFAALEANVSPAAVGPRLRQLAGEHSQWPDLLATLDREITLLERRGTQGSAGNVVARLREAADIALDRIEDPHKAVGYLQRAHRLAPTDEELAGELESTAERHGLWQAMIELWGGRLERAATNLGRYDACRAIAKLHEERLGDPEKAFEWIRQAWSDLRMSDPALASDAFDYLRELAERHKLWPQLVDFHLDRARNSKASDETLAALQAAAEVFDERLNDPLSAMRTLVHALDEPGSEHVLDEIRRLGDKVDERRDGDLPAIGALVLLAVLQRLVPRSRQPSTTIELLAERGRIREERLGDRAAAMAEWIRVLKIDPDHDEALGELERLADEGDLWQLYLVVPSSALELVGPPEDRAVLLKRVAQLYEGVLGRPEYALRARLMAWRTRPGLPLSEGEIDDEHGAIWRLAEHTGTYQTPPVPKDPLLLPSITPPEIADQASWIGAGLDLRLLDTLPSPYVPRVELAAPALVRRGGTVPVSLDDEESGVHAPQDLDPSDSQIMEVEEFEEVDELAELPTADPTVAHAQPQPAPPGKIEEATRAAMAPSNPAPPPPPRAPDHGLPPLPKLTRPILPPRPRVVSA